MKKANRWIGILAVVVLCLSAGSVTGCRQKNDSVHIWSTYNTLKVLRDYAGPPADGGTYPDLGQKLDILMALGDTEGAQLIVTPDYNVGSAVLTPGVMRMLDGTVFPSDKITVYYQYYIEVLNKTSGQQNYNYPTGWIPDMMVPMDLCVQFGENSIGAGHNQGFTVEFTTTSATKAGTYTGTFELNLDGAVTPIPVTVRVENIDVTQAYGQTSIWNLADTMYGKYDNTTFYRTYYEQSLNEYKFCLDALPDVDDPVKMAQNAVYYWNNPNFTSFGLPAKSYHINKNLYMKRGDVYEYLYALAKASTPEMVLTDKAYFMTLVDEPTPDEYQSCIDAVQDIYLVEEMVIDDLVAEGFYDAFADASFRETLETSIRTIPIPQTANRSQASVLGANVNSYCTHIHQFNSASMREMYKELRQANRDRGAVTWFYTCIEPTYPHPADHIDDYQISLRTMRWMQKEYDIDGYLHWSFFYYHVGYAASENCDPYTEAMRFPGVNGDGFKTYPGTRYGLEGYLPSIRLATFRDGQEDYNMLCELDALIAENERFYGLPTGTTDTSEVLLTDLYRNLYNGTIYNPDDAVFYQTREKLFSIVGMLSDSRFSIESHIAEDTSVSTIYLDKRYSLKVDGKAAKPTGIAGQGVKYVFTRPLSEETAFDIELIKDGRTEETFSVFFEGATVMLELTEEANDLTVGDGCTLTYADDGAHAVLVPQGDDFITMIEYVPAIEFRTITDLKTVQDIVLTVTNTGTDDVTVKGSIASAFNSLVLSTVTLKPGETKEIVFSAVASYENQLSWFADAKFRLCIDNLNADGQLASPAYITVRQARYTKVPTRSK